MAVKKNCSVMEEYPSGIRINAPAAVISAFQRDYPQIHINLLEGIDEAETRSRLDRIKATTKALIGAPTPNTPQDDQDYLPDDDYIDVEATPLEDLIDDPEPSSSQDEPIYDEEDLDEF